MGAEWVTSAKLLKPPTPLAGVYKLTGLFLAYGVRSLVYEIVQSDLFR